MTKRISAHDIEEFTNVLNASTVNSMVDFRSAVFVFAQHPQLGAIVGISTPNEQFILTNGV